MDIYFFDTRDGVEHSKDKVGQRLADRAASRSHAQSMLAHIAQDQLPDGERRDFSVDVRDCRSILIYTCTLALTGRWLDHTLPPTANRGSLSQV